MISRFLAATFLIAAPISVSAQDEWTSNDIWSLVGENFGLASMIEAKTFENSNVHAQMRRVGIENSCRLIANFVDEEATVRSEQYRSAVLDEFEWWASRTQGKRLLAFTPNGGGFSALMRGVERRDPQLFLDAYEAISSKLIPLLEAQPDSSADWRGPVTGWDFETPNRTIWASACIVANGEDPEVRRLPFDGFYMERPN